MPAAHCPSCDTPIRSAALREGICPYCGMPIPKGMLNEAPRRGTISTGAALQRIGLWVLSLLLLLIFGLPGLLFSMAKHGQITGPAVPVIFAVYLAIFALGGIVGLFSPST
jgi:hypothetical protein